MTADKAQEIIKRAVADPNLYHAMAARENEFRGGNSAGAGAFSDASRMQALSQ